MSPGARSTTPYMYGWWGPVQDSNIALDLTLDRDGIQAGIA